MLRPALFVFANLIFLNPKRRVEIEFFDITKEAKENAKKLSRREFNVYLEGLYNVHGEENARFIKHHFLSPKLKKELPKKIKSVKSDDVKSINYSKIPEKWKNHFYI